MDNNKAIAALYAYYNDVIKLHVEFDAGNVDAFRFSVDITSGEGGNVLATGRGVSLDEAVSNALDDIKQTLQEEQIRKERAHQTEIQKIQNTLETLGDDNGSD